MSSNKVADYLEEVIKGSWYAGESNCAYVDPEHVYERVIELLREQGWCPPTDKLPIGSEVFSPALNEIVKIGF